MRIKHIVFYCSILFLTACVNSTQSEQTMSRRERAKLNQQLGARYLKMGMLKAAKEQLESALMLDSDNAEIHNAVGVLYERLKKSDLSGQHYRRAMELDSENFSIKNNYGRFLCDKGEYELAMKLLKESSEMPLNDRKWFAYTNIGRCELKQGNRIKAEGYLRQALKENSRYSAALYEMQKISFHAGKYLSSRAFLERYLSVANHNSQTLYIAIKTEHALGDEKLSNQYRERLYTQFPASDETIRLKTEHK